VIAGEASVLPKRFLASLQFLFVPLLLEQSAVNHQVSFPFSFLFSLVFFVFFFPHLFFSFLQPFFP